MKMCRSVKSENMKLLKMLLGVLMVFLKLKNDVVLRMLCLLNSLFLFFDSVIVGGRNAAQRLSLPAIKQKMHQM